MNKFLANPNETHTCSLAAFTKACSKPQIIVVGFNSTFISDATLCKHRNMAVYVSTHLFDVRMKHTDTAKYIRK